jgi:hypothetical protein
LETNFSAFTPTNEAHKINGKCYSAWQSFQNFIFKSMQKATGGPVGKSVKSEVF